MNDTFRNKKGLLILIIILILAFIITYMLDKAPNTNGNPPHSVSQSQASSTDVSASIGTTTEMGDQVDPTLEQAVVKAYGIRRTVFLDNNLTEVRNYFLNQKNSIVTSQINALDNADLRTFIAEFNKIQTPVTPDTLAQASSTWIFTVAMQAVQVQVPVPLANFAGLATGFGIIKIDMVKIGGTWY